MDKKASSKITNAFNNEKQKKIEKWKYKYIKYLKNIKNSEIGNAKKYYHTIILQKVTICYQK